MSVKSTLIAAGIILLVFAVIGYFYGEHKYDKGYEDCLNSLTIDSTKTDTLTIVKYDTVYINIHHYVRADVDTVNESLVFSTKIDTSVVIDKDTVVTLNQSISFSQGYFDIITDIQIRPVEKLVEVVKKVFRTVKVPVPADPPFYNTFWFGSVFTAIAILLIGLL